MVISYNCPTCIAYLEVVYMPSTKRAILRIGKETYGTKKLEEAFREALAPYFTEVEKENESKN